MMIEVEKVKEGFRVTARLQLKENGASEDYVDLNATALITNTEVAEGQLLGPSTILVHKMLQKWRGPLVYSVAEAIGHGIAGATGAATTGPGDAGEGVPRY